MQNKFRGSKAVRFVGGVLTAGVLFLISACGANNGGGSESGSNDSADEGRGGEAVDLTIWTYWDGNNAQVFESFVDDYLSQNDGVNIEVVTVPGSDLLMKIQTGARADKLPDISIGDLVWVPRIAQTGKLVDLTDAISDDTFSDIYPEMLSFGDIDGKQLSIPVSSNTLGLMYNKDLWEEAGVDADAPLTTWEDLEAISAQILDETGKPGFELLTDPGDDGEGLTWNFQVTLWQAGGQFLTEDNSAAAFNSPEGEQALQWWIDLIDKGYSPLAPWGEFEKGAAGSAQEGSWMVGIWDEDPPFEFGTAQIPHPSNGQPATNMGGEQAVVFSDDENAQRAAAEFLNWFVAPEQHLKWSQETGFLPVRVSVAESDNYADFVAETLPAVQPFVDALPNAQARPNSPVYPQVSLAFAREVEQALHGKKSASEALTDAETEVNQILSDAN